MAYVIVPQCCEKLTIFWLIFTNIQTKATDFALKMAVFLMILAEFYQKFLPKDKILVNNLGPKNCVFLLIACSKFAPKSIHQIARFQLQKCKIFQLLRGHPHAHSSVPPNHPPTMSKMNLRASTWSPMVYYFCWKTKTNKQNVYWFCNITNKWYNQTTFF